MRKQLISTLLVGALVLASSAPMASAAATTATSSGSGSVYAPTEIVDVVVPTSVKIAFNPLGVAVKNADFNGNTQILSGTYAIQNRSTIPMQVAAAFKVTAGTASLVKEEQVAADNQLTTAPAKAEFSLGVVTTAYGSTPVLPNAVPEKAADSTSTSRSDAALTGDASTNIIKIGKASAKSTPLITAAGDTIKFMLNKGPYTAVYDAEKNDIVYQANTKGVYDTVAFQFTGTTLKNAALWDKVTTAPKVDVTYTLTESTEAGYAATPFSPDSKNMIQEKADVTKTGATAAAPYTFEAKPSVTMDKADPTVPTASQKVTVLSLTPGAKAVSYGINTFGTYAVNENDATGETTYTYAVGGSDADSLAPGFYKVTVGGKSFILNVK